MIDLLDYIPDCEKPLLLTTGVDADDYLADAIAEGDGVILLPRGKLLFDETIHLKRRVHLIGEGGGLAGIAVTQMIFAPDTAGIVVHRHNTGPDGIEPSSTAADGSIIEGVYLQGSGTAGNGIRMRARATVRQVMINGFGEHGIAIIASIAASDPFVEGNANNWQIDTVRATHCGGSGLFIDGDNVNAGVSIGFDATSNGGWGIFDSSFLGNAHIASHAANNGSGAYKTDSLNARNLFLGCYSEGGQPSSDISHPSMVLGGLHGVGVTGSAMQIRDGARLTPFFVPGVNSQRSVNYRIGQYESAGFDIVAAGDHPHGWSLGWWDEASGTVQFRHARAAGRHPFLLTTDLTTLLDESGAELGPGQVVMNGVRSRMANGRYRYVDFIAMSDKIAELEARIEALESP